MEVGRKKNMRMLREAWAASNPAHCNEKTPRKNTKRRHKTWVFAQTGVGVETESMSVNKGWKRKMKKDDAEEGGRGGRGGGFKLDEAKIRVKGKI